MTPDYIKKWQKENAEHLKAYRKQYREKNRQKILAQNKQYREQNKAKVLKASADWAKKNPDKISQKDARMKEKYPEKYAARQAVLIAVRKGELVRQPCAICGNPKVEAHHEDYLRPLNVIWFCNKHHVEHHKNKKPCLMSISFPSELTQTRT